MLDTTQRVVVLACMACYVLFWVAVAIPERRTTRLLKWAATTIRRCYAPDDDTEVNRHGAAHGAGQPMHPESGNEEPTA